MLEGKSIYGKWAESYLLSLVASKPRHLGERTQSGIELPPIIGSIKTWLPKPKETMSF